jgi:hypothetical protein
MCGLWLWRQRDVLDANTVMAGLVPAIHAFTACGTDVDARDKPGHDRV